jgi:hypothetical protein
MRSSSLSDETGAFAAAKVPVELGSLLLLGSVGGNKTFL